MKALTILGPWAWAIVYGPKRTENRSWLTHYRGPLAIHCGVSRKADAVARACLESLGVACPAPAELDALRGRVIGVCELVACAALEDARRPMLEPDPFAVGPFCWALESPRAIAGVACTGQLSLWELPEAVERIVRRQLESAGC